MGIGDDLATVLSTDDLFDHRGDVDAAIRAGRLEDLVAVAAEHPGAVGVVASGLAYHGTAEATAAYHRVVDGVLAAGDDRAVLDAIAPALMAGDLVVVDHAFEVFWSSD